MLTATLFETLKSFQCQKDIFKESFIDRNKEPENENFCRVNFSATSPTLFRAWHKQERSKTDNFVTKEFNSMLPLLSTRGCSR